ncbi:MAG: SHOCT domain-containing protein [Coriobacteriia bacterium]|jgi:uncharacterized membrane protein|nr:SHOCT domain-containing protein [Coriobacteriia bacterium]
MGVEQVLIGALALLAIFAIHTGQSLARLGRIPVPASSPADGALRITRDRLAHGEIDVAEYERIKRVLRG